MCFFAIYGSIIPKEECRFIFIYGYDIITATAIFFSSFYIYIKSLKYKPANRDKLLSVLWCLLWSVINASGKPLLTPLITGALFCVASIVFITFLTKAKPDTVISAFLFSFGISYVLYYIALAVTTFAFMPFAKSEFIYGTQVSLNKSIYLLVYSLTSILQLALSIFLFRIRRFKNGFPFLFKRYAVILALIVAGTVLALVTWIKIFFEARDYTYYPLLFLGISVVGVGILIWVRRGIKSAYKRWAREHNDALCLQEIAEKDREIQRLTELLEAQRVAGHSIAHRLAAWERATARLAESVQGQRLSAEASEELSAALADIKRLAREYQEQTAQRESAQILPATNVKMLDDLFAHFAAKCADADIDFHLKTNGSIPYMAQAVIEQGKLETMIGDHLQDAFIAVTASDRAFRSILAIIGLSDDCYEIKIYDSGIPFEVDTLVRLGTQRVTTHATSGGSGIGFMTTFQTLRECGASLEITEKHPDSSYSKSVAIRFDGKNRYLIKTYRPDLFPASDRYAVADYAT